RTFVGTLVNGFSPTGSTTAAAAVSIRRVLAGRLDCIAMPLTQRHGCSCKQCQKPIARWRNLRAEPGRSKEKDKVASMSRRVQIVNLLLEDSRQLGSVEH